MLANDRNGDTFTSSRCYVNETLISRILIHAMNFPVSIRIGFS